MRVPNVPKITLTTCDIVRVIIPPRRLGKAASTQHVNKTINWHDGELNSRID